MKTRRTCKEKLLAVLLALAMLLPAVPNLGMVDTAEAASAYTLHEANAGSGGDAYRFKSGKFMRSMSCGTMTVSEKKTHISKETAAQPKPTSRSKCIRQAAKKTTCSTALNMA